MVTEANIYPCNYNAAQSFNTSIPMAVRLPPNGCLVTLRLRLFFGVQNSEFQYLFGFSEKIIFFGV